MISSHGGNISLQCGFLSPILQHEQREMNGHSPQCNIEEDDKLLSLQDKSYFNTVFFKKLKLTKNICD